MREELREGRNGTGTFRKEHIPKKEITDRWYLNYIFIYVVGGLIFFPAAFFTTASDYWMYKFRDLTENNGSRRTYMQKSFLAIFATITEFSSLVVLPYVYLAKKVSLSTRLAVTFVLVFVVEVFTLCMVKIDTDPWQKLFYWLSLGSGSILAVLQTVHYVTMLEIVNKFPLQYLGLIDAASSTSGIVSAIVQIVCLEVGSDSQAVALIYFSIAAAYVFVALVIYIAVVTYSAYYEDRSKIVSLQEPTDISLEQLKRVFWKVKIGVLAVVCCVIPSMIVNPGITSLVESESKGDKTAWTEKFFTPVVVFLLYNVLYLCTRLVVISIKKKPSNAYVLLSLSVIKIGFIPIFMLCNVQPRSHLPVIFNQDYCFIIFMVVFAVMDSFCFISPVLLVAKLGEENQYLANVISAFLQSVSLTAFSYSNILVVDAI